MGVGRRRRSAGLGGGSNGSNKRDGNSLRCRSCAGEAHHDNGKPQADGNERGTHPSCSASLSAGFAECDPGVVACGPMAGVAIDSGRWNNPGLIPIELIRLVGGFRSTNFRHAISWPVEWASCHHARHLRRNGTYVYRVPSESVGAQPHSHLFVAYRLRSDMKRMTASGTRPLTVSPASSASRRSVLDTATGRAATRMDRQPDGGSG